ncbi:opacity protein-like surface antigen [Enterovirga rhinocerotis]|uniref:Opacity protein-like surface antigen n=1 Tax=Enterovirga rhinocerotis TaxID=1339210 RepID=A0A4R7BT37_9HYPH|nr:opacity protein-like surface antigen [Enterovirga rhinocerotis]
MKRVALTLAATLLAAPAIAADPAMDGFPGGTAAPLNTSGWYLRGDIGGFAHLRSSVEGLLPNGDIRSFERERISDALSLGGGVGYRFNEWLRADVTAEWRTPSGFKATNSGSNYVNGFSAEKASLSSSAYMLNGYVDLGTWAGITPYLGAGIGIASKRIDTWRTQVVCFTAACTPSGPKLTLPSTSRTDLAWALMAGAGVGLADGLALDVGYRYLDLGPMKTNRDLYGVSAKMADVRAHEARIGLRYLFP